jgi:hypothetical protein
MKGKKRKVVTYETITQAQYRSFQQAFDFFNAELFDGSLPQLLVTLQRKGSTHGYFSPDRFVGRTKGATAHELALNPDHFTGRSDEEILSTLAHEQVHLWQQVAGSPPRRGYHNKEFAAKMKEIGLHPSDTGQRGGRETGQKMSHYIITDGPFSKAYTQLAKDGLKLDWQSKPRERTQRESKTRFTCPECGQNAWAKPDAKLVCGICEVPMKSAGSPEEVNVSYATNAA